jgi:mannose-1-phosphate guanylyltransferase / mannose-6-phosphate isomerase
MVNPVIVVTPADQAITNTVALTQAVQEAIREASEGSIIILGITPDRPETGYGYIETHAGNLGEDDIVRFDDHYGRSSL